MEPHLHVITLGVDDLEQALVFYRDGLGLPTDGVVANDLVDEQTGAAGAIVIFELDGGLTLTLYPRSELAKDAAVPSGPPQSGEFSLGQLVASRADVDRILKQAAAAGASVTPPHDRPWGIYSGYFRDPDGHLWELIWRADGRSETADPSCWSLQRRRPRGAHDSRLEQRGDLRLGVAAFAQHLGGVRAELRWGQPVFGALAVDRDGRRDETELGDVLAR